MKRELGLLSNGKIEAVRVLTDSEYEEYRKAALRLLRFSSDQHIFQIVRLNYDAYTKQIKRYFEEYVKDPSMSWPRIDRMILDINRHILNYLSAIRTFLDHSETNLKKRYGKNSERVRRFKNVCSEAYNSNFSYRFLYGLRNYAQHCGMPLGVLSFHSEAVDPHFKYVRHYLEVKFSKNELLSKYDLWGSKLKKEIEQLPDTFAINPHLSEMMKCLEQINLTLIEDDMPELIESARYIQQLIGQTKDKPGTPCILAPKILARSPRGEVERLNMNIESIPLHLVEMIMRIQTQKS